MRRYRFLSCIIDMETMTHPDGLLYVLEEDAERIKREALQRFEMDIPQPYKEVRPLVIRANLGDTVKVRFRNSLDRRLSIHVQGLSYDVNTSDGASVGYNDDSTTSGEIWYTWYADTEGVFLFHDMADPRSTENATNIHGLFGASVADNGHQLPLRAHAEPDGGNP